MIWLLALALNAAWAQTCGEALWPGEIRATDSFLFRPATDFKQSQIILNRAVGLTWAQATENELLDWEDADTVKKHFALPEHRVSLAITEPFAANFISFPAAYANQLTRREGVHPSAQIFAMQLPLAEVHAHLDGRLPIHPDAHVANALGYIRFYRRGPDFVVVELQSEVVKNIRQPAARARYRDWAAQLLLAFEAYAARVRRPATKFRVLVAGDEYQRRRWPGDHSNDGIPLNVTKILYREVPRRLGYQSVRTAYALESKEGQFPIYRERIGEGWAMTAGARAASVHPKRLAFRPKIHSHDRLRRAAKLMKARAPESGAVPPPRTVVTSAPAIAVAYQKLPPTVLYDSPVFAATHARLIATEVPSPLAARLNYTTVVSLARAAETQHQLGRVDFGGERAEYAQLVDADRHGSLRFDDLSGAVTIKGVGRRSRHDKVGPVDRVFVTQDSRIYSHVVWGGLFERHALAEFNTHLALWRLFADLNLRPSIAVPLDVGLPLEIPRVRGSDVELIGVDDYLDTELEDESERIVQARFFARSPSRVFAFPQALHSPTFGRVIPYLLREIYGAFDRPLRLPPVPEALRTHEDHALALRYLAAVSALNPGAAETIKARWLDRSLATLAVIHGAGGHLGGVYRTNFEDGEIPRHLDLDGVGALFGGSAQMRNVSLAGEFRDLDDNVFVPGIRDEIWDDERFRARWLERFQKDDLRDWAETWYAVRLMLDGRADAPDGLKMPTYLLGSPDRKLMTIPHSREPEAATFVDRELRAADVLGAGRPGFTDAELARVYRRHRAFAEAHFKSL